MPPSTGEEAPSSSTVANGAPPLVTMEAKMIVATGHGDCQQLKDMLSKEDSSTMVVVMASGNRTSTPKPRSPVMDARLLAAACSGSFQDLESLLNGEDRHVSDDRTIGSSAMHQASDDEEAILSDSLLYGVTIGGGTVLHVVAANHGDSEDFLNKARLIRRKAPNLLSVQNNGGDTPLHCAARAGNIQMVTLLIDLARGENDNPDSVKKLLETENKSKWTVLHEAVCIGSNDIVKLLMEKESQLAFPKDGTSPLYLAILQRNKIIANTLYELSGGILSYAGPNGQNALHAAILRGKDLTKMLLEWNNNLTLQYDENGSTPLHFAAVAMKEQGQRDLHNIRSQILEANPDALYQADHYGSFPIHVATYFGATWAVTDFLRKSPNCAGLRDARERTFLHVAVNKTETSIVNYACRHRSLSWILNMKDIDGNTALHLAVQAGSFTMFCSLLANRQVDLNILNDKGETPLDIARHNMPKGLYFNQNSEPKIYLGLRSVGALRGICCQGHSNESNNDQAKQNEVHKMDQVKEGTQSLCIGSVLIATVTFGASLAMPGGYRADDHTNGGTPTFAGRYAFDAFTLANTLAFTFSAMATISLMSSGSPLQHPWSRMAHLITAYALMSVSVTSLVCAFALGTYIMLAQVAHKTGVTVCAVSAFILLYQNLEIAIKASVFLPSICRRKGMYQGIFWTIPVASFSFVAITLVQLWPIVVIFCLTILSHTGGEVDPVVQPPTPLV